MEAPACPPAITKSIARSLLKSVVTTPAPVAAKPSAVSADTSVHVLLPLLRQRILCGGAPGAPESGADVMYRSRPPAPCWSTNFQPTRPCSPPIPAALLAAGACSSAALRKGIAGGLATIEFPRSYAHEERPRRP